MNHEDTVCIIGGGAAGFFSAIHNKHNYPNRRVLILESSSKLLSKVKRSGGGRCNVTHNCFDPKRLINYYPNGAKELLGCFFKFGPSDTIDWFQSRGVLLKVEKDNRVFPVSNCSQDIIDCLIEEAHMLGIEIHTSVKIESLEHTGKAFYLNIKGGRRYFCQKLILATGSSAQGYKWCRALGHDIIEPIPSLFSFVIDDPDLIHLSGVSLPYVSAHLNGRENHQQWGPILITHWGLSGPCIIRLSAFEARYLNNLGYKSSLIIDWLPDVSFEDVTSSISNYKHQFRNKQIGSHSLFQEIPHRLWGLILKRSGVSRSRKMQDLKSYEMNDLVSEIKRGRYSITNRGVFKEEFVTSGGVSRKQIDFKTMESKCCKNLHVLGELLDIDGVTGGFNFQNAWTTGYLSGQ